MTVSLEGSGSQCVRGLMSFGGRQRVLVDTAIVCATQGYPRPHANIPPRQGDRRDLWRHRLCRWRCLADRVRSEAIWDPIRDGRRDLRGIAARQLVDLLARKVTQNEVAPPTAATLITPTLSARRVEPQCTKSGWRELSASYRGRNSECPRAGARVSTGRPLDGRLRWCAGSCVRAGLAPRCPSSRFVVPSRTPGHRLIRS